MYFMHIRWAYLDKLTRTALLLGLHSLRLSIDSHNIQLNYQQNYFKKCCNSLRKNLKNFAYNS